MSDPAVSPSDAQFDPEEAPPEEAADASESEAGPPSQAEAAEDADSLRTEVGKLEDKLLRQAAEYQNYRRRSEADRAEAVRRGHREALLPLLDVYDDLSRSLEAARQAAQSGGGEGAFDALVEGVELVHRKFQDALGRVGVEPIEAEGRPFDENEHEAVMQQPSEDAAPGTVLQEVQPGYRQGDRVLRHARVIVAA